jgi:hypothetical protein
MNSKTQATPKREKGELLFERYLRETGHAGADHLEPDLGIETNPDYEISKGGATAIAEVKEFADGKLHRRLNDPKGNRVFNAGDREQFGDVRKKVSEAARQLKPLKDSGLPLVVVITNPNNIFVPLGDIDVRAAIYGMPAIGGELDPELNQIVNMRPIPGKNGRLTNDHQYISAVVVLGMGSYRGDARQEWLDANEVRLGATYGDDMSAKYAEVFEALQSITAPEGEYVYARVFHMESDEAVPLPPELFDGPHDVHHYLSRQPA